MHKFLFCWLEEVCLYNHVLGSNPGFLTIFIFIFCIYLILNTHSRSSGPAHVAVGDDAVHGEEAYALWGDGKLQLHDIAKHGEAEDDTKHAPV
jgi:hypothetical protein